MTEQSSFEVPVAKRQKLDNTNQTERPRTSRLYSPFRTVGLVSPTSVPFTSIPLGKTTFQITTSVGKSLQTFDLKRGLNLVFLSRPQCPEYITATCAYKDRLLVAWGGSQSTEQQAVWIVRRGKVVGKLESTAILRQPIERLLAFGSWIIGLGPRSIEVWKNETYEHYTSIPNTGTQSGFSGNLCILSTFLNKIFVGRLDGTVEVYNVSTGRLVHAIVPTNASGSVTALSPTPALGTLAIGYSNGAITIQDVEHDEPILKMQQPHDHAVTSISFRTDGVGAGEDGRKDGAMATSSNHSGDVTFWDLNRGGKVVGSLRGAHPVSASSPNSGVVKAEFLPGQPILVSCGLDNSLKTWIFDQSPFNPIPRILHERRGHSAPSNLLRFLPAASDGSEAAGKWLLSASQDHSLWGFSLRKDGQSTELSQGNVKSKAKKIGQLSDGSQGIEQFKAPPITAIACSLNRDGGIGGVSGQVWANTKSTNAEESGMTGWESVVTAHEGDPYARTWSWGRKKAGRWTFEASDHSPVTSVAVTACGTFAIIGSSGGAIDMFNLQSGALRRRFPQPLTKAQFKDYNKDPSSAPLAARHRSRISGLVVDGLNQTLLSTDASGQLVFWDFSTSKVVHKRSLGGIAIASTIYSPTSNLVALACDDLAIRILDLQSYKTVRELWGCMGQIYDLCFSHDGRWIVACSMDSVVRTFDIATGHLIDAFKTETATSVAFSSTGEFLATTHASSVGINIWTNKSLYMHIPTRQINEEHDLIDLTDFASLETTIPLPPQTSSGEAENRTLLEHDENGLQSEVEQLDSALLTLSLMPQSRWQTLLNLESIKQRNKPIQPPEKPKAAPFFLGSALTSGAGTSASASRLLLEDSQTTDAAGRQKQVSDAERSRISRLASLRNAESDFSRLLTEFADSASSSPTRKPLAISNSNTTNLSSPTLTALITHLKSLPPSATDLEIRTLTPSEIPLFISALTAQLRLRRDFELVNTWMSVFLRLHGDLVSEVEEVRECVLQWRTVMEEERRRLDRLVGFGRGIVEFLRSSR